MIKGLAGRTTILLSTHILPEVSQLCSKIIILDRGTIVAVDKEQHLNAFLHPGNAAFAVLIESSDGLVMEKLGVLPGVRRVQLGQSLPPSAARY